MTPRHSSGSQRAGRFRMASAIGLRHPASASCLGRHSRLAGRCPNNSSLFPPLAAVVVVALWPYSAERLFLIEQSRSVCGRSGFAFSRKGVVTGNCICSAAFCESAALRGTFSGLNSPSQSLTALPAPSEREPLARPEGFSLHPMGRTACALSVIATRCHTPPFVTCGDIFPRSGGSLSSKGEPRALPETFSLRLKLQQLA